MSEDLKEKLKSEEEECDWSMLEQHHERGAVVIVDQSVDLLDAAVAVAKDDVENVKSWQASGKIAHPSPDQLELWKNDPHKKMARFVIIQPFVLVQPI